MPDNKKRVTIRCWSADCGREYTVLREFGADARFLIACPFCDRAAVVDLDPFRSPVWNRYAGPGGAAYTLDALNLPDVLPSAPLPPDPEDQP